MSLALKAIEGFWAAVMGARQSEQTGVGVVVWAWEVELSLLPFQKTVSEAGSLGGQSGSSILGMDTPFPRQLSLINLLSLQPHPPGKPADHLRNLAPQVPHCQHSLNRGRRCITVA